jgi:hypothetical protein
MEFDCKIARPLEQEPDEPLGGGAFFAVRRGHSLTPCGSSLLVFGGAVLGEEGMTNQLLRLDLERMTWHLQVTCMSLCL